MHTEQLDHTEPASTTEMLQADASPAALASLGGLQIADYDLTERLGAGGYGEVWKATGPGGLPKAVKILYGERDGSHAEAELKALERMRELRHPFLLNIERIEVVNSRLIVVTELADGNLSDVFDKYKADGKAGIPRDELLNLLKDAADALDYMSEKHGLQHLDIKPDNILIQGDHAKVGDFGLAKDLNVTNVSVLNGFTPTFAAPEIFEGRPGRASDQYSLAIVYQYMLTGHVPFNGRTAAQLTAQHLRSQPDLVALEPVDRPVIARALSKRQHSRFDSCRQFVDELARRKHSRSTARVQSNAGDVIAKRVQTEVLADGHNDASDLSKEESTPIAISPEAASGKAKRNVVFVGIGGFAGNALTRLKQLNVVASPDRELNMLQIDTDRKALNDLSQSDAAFLSAEEKLSIPLRSSKEYRKASDLDLSWLSRRWLFNIPRSQQVDGIRPLARLAVCDHARTVRQHLEQLITNAEDSGGLDVYVVAATSGGTGSGAVLDLGLLLKTIVAEKSLNDVQVHGVLVHGTGSIRNVTDVQEANTTSVLQELSHLSTTGVASRRGLDNRSSETTPFDHTYLVHIGDGLSNKDFANEAGNVAGFLLSATTDAQFDYRAWREGTPEQHEYTLRMIGVSNRDPDSFSAAAEEGTGLCRQMMRRWCGMNKSMNVSVDLTETTSILQEMKLTPETLPPQVRALLQGECGRNVDSIATNAFETLSRMDGFEAMSRGQVFAFLAKEIASSTPKPAEHKSLQQTITELQSTLGGITANCQRTLKEHLTSLLDSPRRLHSSVEAGQMVLATVNATKQSCQQLLTEIETAYAQFVNNSTEQEQFSAQNGLSVAETIHAACREYCCLIAYQTVYQCFTNHVATVADSVEQYLKQLNQLTSQLQEIVGDDGPAINSIPEPIVDAFDRHLRTVFPSMLGDHVRRSTDCKLLHNLCQHAATQFLMAASERSERSSDASASFPKNCWPRFRGNGGRRRVLGIVPPAFDQKELLETLREEFADCVATRSGKTAQVCVVCEIEGVPVKKVVTRLTHTNPHVADVAGRIHTRTDVDW